MKNRSTYKIWFINFLAKSYFWLVTAC